MQNVNDGKFIVVQGGKRVSGTLHGTQQEAITEAEKLKKLRESQGQASKAQSPIEVKQQLFG